jgi:hypothetical protein
MKLIIALITLTALTACSTTKMKFGTLKKKPDHYTLVGRLNIEYNGNKVPRCDIAFSGGNIYTVDETNLIYINVPKEKDSNVVKLHHISCKDNGSFANYYYKLDNVTVKLEEDKDVYYFGDINVKWKSDIGPKVTSFLGPIGLVIDSYRKEGNLDFSVVSNKSTISNFLNDNKDFKDTDVAISLIK